MFRFSILSIFCVCIVTSTVWAHTVPNSYEITFSGHGTKRLGDSGVTQLDHTADPHTHTFEYGWRVGNSHHSVQKTVDFSPPPDPPEPVMHSHPFTASRHGDYELHFHGGETHHHEDATPGHTHQHDHSNVPKRTQTNNPTNQPRNQPTNQPTVTTPTVGGGGGGGGSGGGGPAPTVEASSTTDGTPTPQPVGPITTSAPQVVQPSTPLMQPLRVTEYMVRDWGGVSNLPQWIELYNPNTEAVNLKDWTFQYATRPFANHPYVIHTLTLADDTQDGFSIAGGGVAILATQAKLPARRFSGIQASQVYALGIPNELKSGWVLTDASGKEVYRIGKRAFSALRDPVEPPHQGRARVSHERYKSEKPTEPYYYGYRPDVGSPGFYEQSAPAAPSAVRKPKKAIVWGHLKQVK